MKRVKEIDIYMKLTKKWRLTSMNVVDVISANAHIINYKLGLLMNL
jgi:hypothetical protein